MDLRGIRIYLGVNGLGRQVPQPARIPAIVHFPAAATAPARDPAQPPPKTLRP